MNVPSLATFFDHSTSLQVTWLLLHFLWQGCAIAAVVFIVNLLASRRSPKLRYGVAVAGLVAMIASVATTWLILRPSIPKIDTAAMIAVYDVDTAQELNPGLRVDIEEIPEVHSPLEVWAPMATAIYALGVSLMLMRLILSAIGVGRLRYVSKRTGSELAERVAPLSLKIGLRMKPVLRTCARVVVPFVAGVIKPAILLPSFVATGLTQAELDAILLHELAHIRRGDLLVNLLQRITESLLFFHPSVWYVSRVITAERENCCDDMVLGHCSQKVYASALIRLAEACSGKSSDIAPIAALAATGASPSQLKRRVMRILGVKPAPQFHKPHVGILLACVAAVTITAVHLQAQTENNGSDATTSDDSEPTRPLRMMVDEDGKIAEFTADTNSMLRLTAILQNLSANTNVVINSTKIGRKGDRLTMTVSGENLDFMAVRGAVNKADWPRVKKIIDEMEQKKSKQMADSKAKSANTRFHIESLGDVTILRGEQLDDATAKSIVAEFRKRILKDKGTHDFSGPVQMESLGDSIVLRGNKQDVDRMIRIIESIEDLSMEAELRRLLSEEQRLSEVYVESHPVRVRAEEEIAKLRKQLDRATKKLRKQTELKLMELRLRANELGDRFGADHPSRKAVEKQIAVLEKSLVDILKKQLEPPPEDASTHEPRVSREAKVPTVTGPIQFELFGDDAFTVRGSKEDVNRVMKVIEKVRDSNKATREKLEPGSAKDSPPVLTGPVRIEFVEDTDIFVVRGKKEDVDRIMEVIGNKKHPDDAGSTKPNAEDNQPGVHDNGRTESKAEQKLAIDEKIARFAAYRLRHTLAESIADILTRIFHDRIANDPEPKLLIKADIKKNRIIVRGTKAYQNEIADLLKDLDKPAVDKRFHLYDLKRLPAKETAELINRMMGADEHFAMAIPDIERNRLFISADEQQRKQIEELLKQIGVKPANSSPVKNDEASEVNKGKTTRKTNAPWAAERTAQLYQQQLRELVAEIDALQPESAVRDRLFDKVVELKDKILALKRKTGNRTIDRDDNGDFIVYPGGMTTIRGLGDRSPQGALRFPVEVERAMMGDAAPRPIPTSPINPTPEIPAGKLLENQFRFPEEIERGMMIDAQEGRGY